MKLYNEKNAAFRELMTSLRLINSNSGDIMEKVTNANSL